MDRSTKHGKKIQWASLLCYGWQKIIAEGLVGRLLNDCLKYLDSEVNKNHIFNFRIRMLLLTYKIFRFCCYAISNENVQVSEYKHYNTLPTFLEFLDAQ